MLASWRDTTTNKRSSFFCVCEVRAVGSVGVMGVGRIEGEGGSSSFGNYFI